MPYCDAAIHRWATHAAYRECLSLSPARRAARLFFLKINALSLRIEDTDEILGWFLFDKEAPAEEAHFPDAAPTLALRELWDAPLRHGSRTCVDKGHTLLDYGELLTWGLDRYQREVDTALAAHEGEELLLAMKESLAAVADLVEKMRLAALEKYKATGVEKFSLLAEGLAQVPFHPARSFREAVQAIWILHFLAPLAENAWYSISLGRLDQYLLPYYRRSRQEGMTEEEAFSILSHLYRLLNSYADGACLLNIGSDYNELSCLLIRCQKTLGLPGPILGARITEETPKEIWQLLVDEKLFSHGQPTFYGEASCRAALAEKGVPEEQIPHFSNNSCMGIGFPGEEFNSMWGCVFSVSAALEAALCQGQLLSRDYRVPGIPPISSLEEAYAAFEKAADHLLGICAASYEARATFSEERDPDPWLSLLTKGCIQKRKDRISGAAYHNVTVECMGMINAADGLCALDRLVFTKGKYSLSQVIEGVKENFQGKEALRRALLDSPKFGRDPEADAKAWRIADILQRLIRRHSHGNLIYSPSLHTLDANVGYGSDWGAGFDGRGAGEPFAKNAGPSDLVRKKDPTTLILSAMGLPQHTFFGGQPIDINFSPEAVRCQGEKIAELIRVYLLGGGLQLQVNSLSSALLWDAIRHPERHTDLVVRIGGFSNYFNAFPEATKREFAQRIAREEQ